MMKDIALTANVSPQQQDSKVMTVPTRVETSSARGRQSLACLRQSELDFSGISN
jgi:hypothetical protein